MATLKSTDTNQIVEGVDRDTFLAEVSDPHFWIEIGEDIEAAAEKVVEEVKVIAGSVATGIENLFNQEPQA